MIAFGDLLVKLHHFRVDVAIDSYVSPRAGESSRSSPRRMKPKTAAHGAAQITTLSGIAEFARDFCIASTTCMRI